MDFKEYLINSSPIDLSYIAERMWPNNKSAKTYLSMKLNGKRPWTDKDNDLAKETINKIGKELSEL